MSNNLDRIFQEMQAADAMRQQRSAAKERAGEAFDGLMAGLWDVHRRVVDEPWCGKTIHDTTKMITERQAAGLYGQPAQEDIQTGLYGYQPEATQEEAVFHTHATRPGDSQEKEQTIAAIEQEFEAQWEAEMAATGQEEEQTQEAAQEQEQQQAPQQDEGMER